MLISIVGVLIFLYSFINFKRSFLLFLIYQMFWYERIIILSIGSINISISLLLMFLYFFFYFFKGNVKTKPKCRIPFGIPFVLIIVSYFASCFTTLSTFPGELLGTLTSISREILIAWLIWYVVENKEDFLFLFKAMSIVIFIACVLGIIEYVIGHNYIIDLKNAGVSLESQIATYDSYGGNVATSRGYRISSIFEHPIGAGMTFALFSSCVFYLYINNQQEFKMIKGYRLYLAIAILCIPCILLTKMRSALLFFVLILPSMINFRKKGFYRLLFFTLVLVFIAWPYLESYITLFLSIFDSSSSYSVNGSSIEQRLSQFYAAQELMKLSPIFGLGGNGKYKIVNEYTKAMLNYESLWLGEMVSRGIFGVLVNIVLAFYSILVIPRKFNNRYIFWLFVSYWVTCTLSSIPSFRFALFYVVIFGMIKMSNSYETMRQQKYKIFKLKI